MHAAEGGWSVRISGFDPERALPMGEPGARRRVEKALLGKARVAPLDRHNHSRLEDGEKLKDDESQGLSHLKIVGFTSYEIGRGFALSEKPIDPLR